MIKDLEWIKGYNIIFGNSSFEEAGDRKRDLLEAYNDLFYKHNRCLQSSLQWDSASITNNLTYFCRETSSTLLFSQYVILKSENYDRN